MFWTKARKDKYGRTTYELHAQGGRILGVVVKLPRIPGNRVALSNDWTQRGEQAVDYHDSIQEARAHLESIHQGQDRANVQGYEPVVSR